MRLIDADVIHGEIDIFNPEGRMSLKNIKIYIDAQPTAYDVNKVMEELEVLHEIVRIDQKLAVSQAIEIVKGGGRDETD